MRQPPPGAPPLFREIDHTADRGIVIDGSSPAELFEKSGLALSAIMVAPEGVEAREQRALAVSGADRADTLQRWLSEILVLFAAEGFVVAEVIVDEASPELVRGLLRGENFDPHRHERNAEVKAVTYHDLEVRQDRGGWQARVIVDV